jgi:hypothetical protein
VDGQVQPGQGLDLDLAGPVDLLDLLGHEQYVAAPVVRSSAHAVSFLLVFGADPSVTAGNALG